MRPKANKNGVSVIMPAYNAHKTIGRAIESALRQGVEPLEVIVVDDGSSDGTASVVRKFKGPVRYVRQTNRGVSTARNRGIQLARYESIAFLDADDEWRAGKLKRQMKILQQRPGAGLCATGMRFIAPNGRVRGSFGVRKRGRVLQDLMDKNLFATSSVVVRKSVLPKRRDLFQSRLVYGEDYLLWVEIALKHAFYVIPDRLVDYQLSPKPHFASKYSEADVRKLFAAIERLVKGVCGKAGLRRLRSQMHMELSVLHRQRGDHSRMMSETLQAVREYPWLSMYRQKQAVHNLSLRLGSWVGFHGKK